MDLTQSMFATSADYWKARAELAESTVRETAEELGCEPDNEAMLLAAQDAGRYRWLRDGNNDTEGLCPFVAGEDLDRAIDAAMAGGAAVG